MKKLVITLAVLAGTVVMLITGLWLLYTVFSSSMRSNWESELKTKLAASDSYPGLHDSLTSLGTMLGDEQGHWIAIDYRDTHAGIIASKAVARMKDGTLLESDEHYCGLFAIYTNFKNMWESEQEIASESERSTFKEYCEDLGTDELLELVAIESAQDPEQQRDLLLQLGFQAVD